MAFPTVADRATSTEAADVTSHTISLPASVPADNLLLALISCDGNQSFTWPAGWTEIKDDVHSSLTVSVGVAYRQADGTEGATITVTTPGAEQSAHIVYEITGHQDPAVQAPHISSMDEGNSLTPDPRILFPDAALQGFLWFAIAANDDDQITLDYPTNYATESETNGAVSVQSSTGSDTCTMAATWRPLSAESENPGVFTNGSVEDWLAGTIAIPVLGAGIFIEMTALAAPVATVTPLGATFYLAVAKGVATITTIVTRFARPFTGHGGLGMLDSVGRWKTRRGTWRRRR